jgi:hypothetical protein
MKYDLEVVISGILTDVGKERLAEIFYGNLENGLPGALFNKTSLGHREFINIDQYKLDNWYRYMKDIEPEYFRSYMRYEGTIIDRRYVIKRGAFIPFFSAGKLIFHKYELPYSNDTARLITSYDNLFDRYVMQIPDSAKYETIRIITSKLTQHGTIDIDMDFSFIDESEITLAFIEGTPPNVYAKNSILVSLSNGVPVSIYNTPYNNITYQIANDLEIVTGDFDTIKGTMPNNKFYVNVDSQLVLIKKDDKFYNYRHKLLFAKSNYEFAYTISKDPETQVDTVYLSASEILLEQQISVTIEPLKYKVIFYPKYMVVNQNFSPVPDNITVRNFDNGIRFYNTSSEAITVDGILSGTITPIVEFDRYIIPDEKNIKHIKIDISPRNINYGDGILCFANAEVSRKNIVAYITLELSSTIFAPYDSIEVTAILENEDHVALPGKAVTLSLLNSQNGMIAWGEPADETNSISGVTNFAGKFSSTLLNNEVEYGYFIQKEWVGEIESFTESGFSYAPLSLNTMYIPWDIGITNVDKIFPYLVTADDPLIGQIRDKGGLYGITSELFATPKLYDYYADVNSIKTYELIGRKIAYVKLSAADNITDTTEYTVKSRFIKPISIEIIDAEKEFFGRNLYKYSPFIGQLGASNLPTILSDLEHADFTYMPGSEFEIESEISQAFLQNWLLTEGKFSYFRFIVNKYTKLTFAEPLPGYDDDNIAGYFLRYARDEAIIPLRATHYDDFIDITLVAERNDLQLSTFASSEDSITLSTEINKINSYIGPLSYLSITDYLTNQYGTSFCTYICKYSNKASSLAPLNRCNHPTVSNRGYYNGAPSGMNLYCAHNFQFDSSLPSGPPSPNHKCPAMEVQLVNPFVLYSE